jgi:hypothetical protein
MVDAHKNFAISSVALAPSPDVSGTSLDVDTGTASRFPDVPFNASVWPANLTPDPTNAEIVRVATDTLTIVRAQEGTSARAIVAGDKIAAALTAKTITDIESSIKTVVPFTILGNAEQKTYTPRKYFFEAATLKNIKISLGTAGGGGNLVLQLLKNGVNFGSAVGVTAGDYYNSSAQTLSIAQNDYLQVSFTSVGSTPAANVIIELEIV